MTLIFLGDQILIGPPSSRKALDGGPLFLINMNIWKCCDCLLEMASMPSDTVDLIVTDPPYGIDYKSNKQNYITRDTPTKLDRPEYFNKIVGDQAIAYDWLSEAYRILKNNTAIYIFCHWSKWHLLYPEVEKVGFKVKNMVVLNKSNHGMGDLKGSYAPKHELIIFAAKGRHILTGKRTSDVWTAKVKYSGSRRLHPTEKPLSWILPCIERSSQEGQTVLDPFAGSGGVGEACQITNRNYILFDIDQNCCDIIEKRLCQTLKL